MGVFFWFFGFFLLLLFLTAPEACKVPGLGNQIHAAAVTTPNP